jgi:asparagine synthase (glutamine-hydrolysing)
MGIIAGIYSKANQPGLKENLRGMVECQAHRDGSQLVMLAKPSIALGMANKHDAIFCSESDNSDVFVPSESRHNGIHAFVDGIVLDVPRLRKTFESCGISVPMPLCSSIVAVAYEKWGLDFMSHLEGEFACAVWDDSRKRLILARDPYGHKPIHYFHDSRHFVFSSEIKGVLAANINKEIDLVGLSDYLSLNCIPYPGTIFKEIYQVPPGSILVFEKDEIRIKSYWTPAITVNESLAFDDAVEMLSEKIQSAVQKRMVREDSYCLLSGGIDSSAILSFAADMSKTKVHGFTVGFAEAEVNETEYAECMAKHVGAEYHLAIATADSFFDLLDTLVFHHDSPFTDTAAYPNYYAGKLASEFTDVILTGDGPDQSMGGVVHHLFSNRNWLPQRMYNIGSQIALRIYDEPIPSIASKIGRKLYRYSLAPTRASYDLRSFFPNIVKKYVCSEHLWQIHKENDPFRHPDSWFERTEGLDHINQYLYADMTFYVPDDLMFKVDRMSMAHGLETLSPFHDIHLSRVVNQLPGHFKIKKNHDNIISKYILKKCCEKRVPDLILKKKKQGLRIPLNDWLRKDGGSRLKEILLDDRTLNRGYFKKQAIQRMINTFLAGRGDYYYPAPGALSSLLTLELWHRRYLD